MPSFIVVHDIVEANGKTIKENNLERKHKIPLKALVEIDYPDSEYDGVRLFVCEHVRDCDGEPLYNMYHSSNFDGLELYNDQPYIKRAKMLTHFGESSLKVIKLPDEKHGDENGTD